MLPHKASVCGVITGMPEFKPHHYVFNLNTKQYGLMKLSWYGKRPSISPGQQLCARLRLKMTTATKVQTKGFDYPRYLYERGYGGYGSVIQEVSLSKPIDSVSNALSRIRLDIRHELVRQVYRIKGGVKVLPILLAMGIGDKSLLTHNDWQVLQDTGTSHLVAISGLHIGLIALLAYWLARILWSSSIRLTHRWPAQKAGLLFGLVVGGLYALLSGFGLPAQRTLIMLAVVCVAKLKDISIGSFKPWFLALLVCLALEPWGVFSISLWMSFLAVFTLIFMMSHRVGKHKAWWVYLWPQFGIFVLLAPVTIFNFGVLSLISFFVNLWAIPLVSFALVPCLFLGLIFMWCPIVSHVFLWASVHLASIWWWGLSVSNQLPYSSVHLAQPSLGEALLAQLGLLLVFCPRAFPIRKCGFVLIVPFIVSSLSRIVL